MTRHILFRFPRGPRGNTKRQRSAGTSGAAVSGAVEEPVAITAR